MTHYLTIIDRIINDIVSKDAAETDRQGVFPKSAIDALSQSGLLGLISAQNVGGLGQGTRAAALVVEKLARECASTAMITCMHYCAATVIEKYAPLEVRKQLALGNHLATLAFSESGSRSHFWSPVSTATRESGSIRLNARKSWVTAANYATLYVWTSKSVSENGASTLWLVPRGLDGMAIQGSFDGLGLRGNDSTPIVAHEVAIPENAILGEDGQGLNIILETVLPVFNVLSAATGIGLMEGATAATCHHVTATRYDHLDTALCDLPTIRAYLARMRIMTDQARCLWLDTLQALEEGRADTMLRILECKASSGESATQVLDLAMRVCGGAAFRREIGIERRFRDARAGTVMAPTTDQLYEFIGKAICNKPVFE